MPTLMNTLVVCLLLTASMIAPLDGAALQEGPLTWAQVGRLIGVAPDRAIAGEIRSRQLAFRLDEPLLKGLVDRGAGPLTVAALSDFLPSGRVTIASDPETDVFIDGVAMGRTDAAGQFSVKFATGEHRIKLVRTRHHDGNVTIAIAENEETSLALPLEWSVGFVNLTANRPGAVITIEGIGRFTSEANGEGAPGTYSVIVTGPHLQTLREQIVIVGGQTTTRRFEPAVDQSFRAATLAAANRSLQARAWRDAAERAKAASINNIYKSAHRA